MSDLTSIEYTDPYWNAVKELSPKSLDAFYGWLTTILGVQVATCNVCEEHSAPFAMLAEQWFERPPIALWHGPRGGGKTFLSAADSWMESRFTRKLSTRILGGSKDQSSQIYEAMKRFAAPDQEDHAAIKQLNVQSGRFQNDSHVAILAASSTSVRGPHVQRLKLDEVDEIEPDIRESAIGMCMGLHGIKPSILMTSTWHKVGGPMQALIERGRAGEFPVHSFCSFEVLERCPEDRSGPYVGGDAVYERCPSCPIKRYCHDGCDRFDGIPKAKRSGGHYTIDSLVQKVRSVSLAAFESDYMSWRPPVAGLWFPTFSRASNMTIDAEYNPSHPVHLSIDSGVCTGAVWIQFYRRLLGGILTDSVNIFADYYSENELAFEDAKLILAKGETLCQGRREVSTHDPAGESRTATGTTVLAEFERAGLMGLRPWPRREIIDGISLIDAFVRAADGKAALLVHPRCKHVLQAFENYKRAKVRGVWQDYPPAQEQHPFEDLIDPIRGAMLNKYPSGRRPETGVLVSPRRVF